MAIFITKAPTQTHPEIEKIFIHNTATFKKSLAGTIKMLHGQLTFFKEVDYNKHLLRAVDGYAIQEDVFSYLFDNHVKMILIREHKGSEDNFYLSGLKDWLDYNFVRDFNAGLQRCLPVKNMRNIRQEAKEAEEKLKKYNDDVQNQKERKNYENKKRN